MEQKISRTSAVAATAILAVAAFSLRTGQMAAAFNAEGIRTGKGVVFFSCVTIAVLVLFGLYSRSLKGRKKCAAMTDRSLPVMAAGCLAALLMVISGAMLLLRPGQQGEQVVALGSVLTGLCWAAVAMCRYQGKKAHAALFLVPTVFYVVALVFRFRFWTRDPVILDYCYDLAALICVMCAVFHLGSFSFDKGERRRAVFFAMSGVFFCAAALAGASAAQALGYVAAIVWLMDNLWLLLRPVRQK